MESVPITSTTPGPVQFFNYVRYGDIAKSSGVLFQVLILPFLSHSCASVQSSLLP
jgi:hypothetical protein